MKGINRHGVVCINTLLTTQLKSSDRRESPAACPIFYISGIRPDVLTFLAGCVKPKLGRCVQ